MNKMFKLLATFTLLCTGNPLWAAGQAETGDENITLTFATWDSKVYDYMTVENPVNDLYKQTHPNVDIVIEISKDSESFEQTMQIRATAGELPDILPLKTYMLAKYKDLMIPMNEHPSAANNKFAEMYAIDGSVVGLPTASFYEFVYYRKSIYKELGLSVPKTWGEYMANLEAVKKDGRYTPLLIGLKDAWPDYPFNEFMPYLESGDGNYYNVMATMDAPFSPGKPFYKTYSRIQDMYDLDVIGSDPLGVGYDEVKFQFAAGKAAMMAAGQWFISDYANSDGDVNDLGIFFLPVRDSESDPLFATVMADVFFGIPKNTKHQAAAEEFIKWYFDVYYEDMLPRLGVSSCVEGIEITDNPVLMQMAELERPRFIQVAATGPEYTAIKNRIQFDVKKMGQDMASGYYSSLDEMMEKLNKQWADAR